MNSEIIEVTNKTPIEIALQIDEDNYTTARALYEWLELNPAHYARWIERNITSVEYYQENIDYIPFTRRVNDNNPKPTMDYKLSGKVAKRLAAQANNEKGELVLEYYERVEQALILTVKKYNEDIKMLKDGYNELLKANQELRNEIQRVETEAQERYDILDGGSSRREEQDYQDALELGRTIRDEMIPILNFARYKGKDDWNTKEITKEICNIADQDEFCHGYTLKAARDAYNRETGYMERNKGVFPPNLIVIVHSYAYYSSFVEAMNWLKCEYRSYTSEELIEMGYYFEED